MRIAITGVRGIVGQKPVVVGKETEMVRACGNLQPNCPEGPIPDHGDGLPEGEIADELQPGGPGRGLHLDLHHGDLPRSIHDPV